MDENNRDLEQTICAKDTVEEFQLRSFAVFKKSANQISWKKFNVTQSTIVKNSCPPSLEQLSIYFNGFKMVPFVCVVFSLNIFCLSCLFKINLVFVRSDKIKKLSHSNRICPQTEAVNNG